MNSKSLLSRFLWYRNSWKCNNGGVVCQWTHDADAGQIVALHLGLFASDCIGPVSRHLFTSWTMGSPAPNDAPVEPIQGPPSSSSSPDTNVGPEFVAVILAATAGTRLFPLTSEGDDEHGGGGLSDDDDEFDALPQEPDSEEGGRDDGGTGDGNVGAKEAEAAAGTSSDDDDPTVPKHLLPVAGTSIVRRLLGSVASAGFSRCVVAVAASDNGLTAKSVLAEEAAASSGGGGSSSISRVGDHVLRLVIGGCSSSSSAGGGGKKGKGSTDGAVKTMEIYIVTLGASCGGSADAIRHLSGAGAVPASSHLVILPGDLVLAASLGDGSSLRLLADAHRRGQQSGCTRSERAGDASFAPPACTVLLSDVGDEDENGIPLKESAKVRSERGGMSLVFLFVR